MSNITNHVDLISTEKLRPRLKPQHVSHKARPLVFRIPVPRNLRSIFFVEHRIEKRLFRQPRRKFPESTRTYQFEFELPYRPVERG